MLCERQLEHCIRFLDGDALFCCARVSKSWYATCVDDTGAWKAVCHKDFGLDKPVGPPMSKEPREVQSFRLAWMAWRKEYSDFFGNQDDGEIFRRAARSMNKIRNFAQAADPMIYASLQPGISREDLQEFQRSSGVTLPVTMRAIYRLCNGQDQEYVPVRIDISKGDLNWKGLFGGYSFYETVCNIRFLPLHIALDLKRLYQSLLSPTRDGSLVGTDFLEGYMPFASNFQRTHASTPDKLLLVSLTNGHCYSSTGMTPARCSKANPDELSGANTGSNGEAMGCGDGFLCWIESYAGRLEDGWYRTGRLISNMHATVGICLFPTKGPNYSECVTRGVRVSASAIYVPDMSMMEGPQGFFFAYSFRFRLIDPPDSPSALKSCQLLSRHFVFTKHSLQGERSQDRVDGQAVIGMHPYLEYGSLGGGTENKGDFVYQSCCPLPGPTGTMEGHFKFVPGSIEEPTGPPFDVPMGKLVFSVPDYH